MDRCGAPRDLVVHVAAGDCRSGVGGHVRRARIRGAPRREGVDVKVTNFEDEEPKAPDLMIDVASPEFTGTLRNVRVFYYRLTLRLVEVDRDTGLETVAREMLTSKVHSGDALYDRLVGEIEFWRMGAEALHGGPS